MTTEAKIAITAEAATTIGEAAGEAAAIRVSAAVAERGDGVAMVKGRRSKRSREGEDGGGGRDSRSGGDGDKGKFLTLCGGRT